MNDVVKELLRPIVRGFIDDRVFSLFQNLANWCDGKIHSRIAKAVLGMILGLTAIASVVTVTALSGF